jgi:nitrous oxidase accessory protein NosD
MLRQRAFCTGLFFLVGWCGSGYAAKLAVCSNASYTTIGAALKAAAPGDEIDVCPAVYAEQVVITQPVTIHGIGANGFQRVLVQPTAMANVANLPFQAVISVVNTKDVFIDGLAIDASQNTVSGCTVPLAGIHFYNSSGSVSTSTISGAQLVSPKSCTTLFPGNGFGIEVDTAAGQTGPFSVLISGNSIHDFNRDAILVSGAGITTQITGNAISGIGPSTGYFQFGVFIANGAVAQITKNTISQGNCGSIDPTSCINLRSEGVVFRAVGDGSVVDSNFITNAQSGIFINGGNKAQITNNTIMNIDALDGISIQGTASGFFTNSVIAGNTISHVFPIAASASVNGSGCGIEEAPGTGVAQNIIVDNTINDAYCGVAFVTADNLFSGSYFNTLYTSFNADLYPTAFPPAVEP